MTTPDPANPNPNPAPAPVEWTAGLNDDAKQYVSSKGFKDPSSVIESYRQIEKLIGQKEKLIKLPDTDEDASWGEIYDKLGRPKDKKDYNFQMPEKGGDPEFAEWAKGTFHELGISKKQAEKLVSKWNEFAGGKTKHIEETQAAKVQEAVTELKKEWGEAFSKKAAVVDQVAEKFGMTAEQLTSLKQNMGPAGAMKFLHSIGAKLGEDQFVTGDGKSGSSALSPGEAQGRVKTLMQDPDFASRYLNGGEKEKAEMERLHKLMKPTDT